MDFSAGSRKAGFPTTRWSLVAAAGRLPGPDDALGALYNTYWPALYAYVRHRGYRREDAEDLVQSFFSHLIESRAFGRADPVRGRFRSFLLVSLKNFMTSEYLRRTAQKRGGAPRLTIDVTVAEVWYTTCAVDFATPEHVYDRRWALALLERVRRRP